MAGILNARTLTALTAKNAVQQSLLPFVRVVPGYVIVQYQGAEIWVPARDYANTGLVQQIVAVWNEHPEIIVEVPFDAWHAAWDVTQGWDVREAIESAKNREAKRQKKKKIIETVGKVVAGVAAGVIAGGIVKTVAEKTRSLPADKIAEIKDKVTNMAKAKANEVVQGAIQAGVAHISAAAPQVSDAPQPVTQPSNAPLWIAAGLAIIPFI
jgi:hypothetical protein